MAIVLRALFLLAAFPSGQSARLRAQVLAPVEESLEKEMFELSQFFEKAASNVSANASQAGSFTAKQDGPKGKGKGKGKKDGENKTKDKTKEYKCDQACTNGSKDRRAKCMAQCAKMQKIICDEKFTCPSGCGNTNKYMKKDPECQNLCTDVHDSICGPLQWEAPKDMKLSPHHDDEPPPSIEATPEPRIYKGSFMFCNLYAASYSFDILRLKDQEAKDGESMAKLGYKECQEIEMASYEHVGLKVDGKLSGISKPIIKTPSIMLFGQFAFGNHQVEFNRYFATGDGPIICNGMPVWEKKDEGEKIQLFRNQKSLAGLRYKECVPTGLKNGDVLQADVKGKFAGDYTVTESPKVIVLGKAGESGAIAFEAWKKSPAEGL
jgi:hypothetical protein